MSQYTPKDIERFWSKVDILSDSDVCWNWRLSCTDSGYGQIRFHGPKQMAHRTAWEMTYGDIPAGLLVCHHCDNPRCCNPNHLFLGTAKDNAQDMVKKGRNAHNLPKDNRGENNGRHKLTLEQAQEICERWARGIESYRVLAQAYGVSKSTIAHVVRRDSWS